MSHAREPWSTDGDWIVAADGELLVGEYSYLSRDSQRRVVACVNACRGIPTELLERSRMKPGCNVLSIALNGIQGSIDGTEDADGDWKQTALEVREKAMKALADWKEQHGE